MAQFSTLRAQRIKAILVELKAINKEVDFKWFFGTKSILFGLVRETMQGYFDDMVSANRVEINLIKDTIKYIGD